jgi:type IV pilus assembly protein PilM
MVSLDFTDKQIKLVRGSLAGSKIKINDVGTRDLPEGSVVNGYVTNVPLVAGEVTAMLKDMRISDKEVIVCVNSSSILYKELEVLKPKTLKNTAAIEGMIITEMGIGSDYNVSYAVVGESSNDSGAPTIKVMATACPQRLVDGYQALFVQSGLKLKHINISNNCITRLILHTPKLKEVMPFLCIQIDTDFININLYEEGQVALSRYIKIDPSDYDNNPDYVNIAVFDNLFRMIQFIGQRPGAKPLRQIMFYGVIRDFVALSNSIASFNIPSHVLSMPTNIVKFCEVDFSMYANAIGAFYRVDPLLEHIDLLQSKAVKSKQSANLFPLQILAVMGVTAGLVFGARMVIGSINTDLVRQRDAVQAQIDLGNFEARAAEMARAIETRDNYNAYRDSLELSRVLFDFQPRGRLPQIQDELDAAVLLANSNLEVESLHTFHDVEWNSFYTITFDMYVEHRDFPASFAEALNERDFFENIIYSGFEVVTRDEIDDAVVGLPPGNADLVKFSITLRLRGGHIFDTRGRWAEHPSGLRVYRQ